MMAIEIRRATAEKVVAAHPSGSGLGSATAASASDYATAISAYRHAHGLLRVRLDSPLSAVALRQAQAMSLTGSVSHSAAVSFEIRVATLRKSRAAENIGAGYRVSVRC